MRNAPTVTLMNPGNQSNSEEDLVNWGVSATDSAGHAMIYSATNMPAGLTISPGAGIISGKVQDHDSDSGPYNVTVTATDSVDLSDFASQTFTWTVHPKVVLANPGPQSNAAGDTVALQLHATNSAGNALQYNFTLGGTLPPGLTLNQTTGLISGTLTGMAPYSSPYTPTVTATDVTDNIATDSQTFTWTVGTTGGVTVTLMNPGNQASSEGDTVSWNLSATDSANNSLVYSATGLPAGLSINRSTGNISGTVAAGDSFDSAYTVTVSATDSVSGNIGATQSFQWTINPTMTFPNPGAHTNSDGDTIYWQLPASESAGSALSFTATGLPSGLTISTGGCIEGTIATNADTSSPYSVTVTASDHIVSASQTFEWTITPSGGVTVTVANPSNQTDDEGEYVQINDSGSDSAGHSLVFSASNLPPGMSMNSTTAVISGTIAPQASLGSVYQVVLIAIDSVNPVLGASTTFDWTVHPHVTPAASIAPINNEGDTITLNMAATDSTGNPLAYSATGLPSGVTINANTGVITGTLASGASMYSPYLATITATDTTDSAATGIATISWNVYNNGGVAVTLANPGSQLNSEGDTVRWAVSATDSAGHSMVYTATGLPPGLNIAPADGTIWGTIAAGASNNGPYPVTVTAADDLNADDAASQTFQWTVQPAATLPNPGAQQNAVGDTVYWVPPATDSAGNSFNYGAVNLPPGLTINPITGVISGIVASGAVAGSPYTVTLSTTDLQDPAASTTVTFPWTITASGVVTVSLANPGPQTSTDGQPTSVALSATDSEDNPIIYSATGLPPGLAINPSTGSITGTIAQGADAGGPYDVTVSATDNVNGDVGAAVTFPWTVNYGITVSLVNPGTRSNAVGDTVNVALVATDSAADAVTYAATSLPPGLSINGTTGYITGTIASGSQDASPYTVSVTATDALHSIYSATQTFQWNVAASGAITVTISNPGSQTNQDGDTINLTLSATDSASDSVTFSASSLPPGLTLNATTGLISGTIEPGAHLYSPYTSIVTANDSVNPTAGAQATLQWNVNASTTPMVSLANPGAQVNNDGDGVKLRLAGFDSLGNALTYTGIGLPPGVAVNSTTGEVTGNVDSGDDANSPYNVTVTATDSVANSAAASQTFAWWIQPAGQVQVLNPGPQNSAPGDQVSLPINGRDPAGHALAWTANSLPTGLQINPTTGVIFGTVSQGALSFTGWRVSVTATDATNSADSATVQFVWYVLTRTILGPTAVPNNSQYTYSIYIPGQAAGQWQLQNPNTAPNLATLGTAQPSYNQTNDMTTFSVTLTFNNSQAGGTSILNFLNTNSLTIASISIGVVQVDVGEPQTGGPNAFAAGTPHGDPNDLAGQVTNSLNQTFSVVPVSSGTQAQPGLNWNAQVTAFGPATAISQIVAGFVQHAAVTELSGTYDNGRDLTSPMQGQGYYLDVANMVIGSTPPQYNPNPPLPWYTTVFGSVSAANPPIQPVVTFSPAQTNVTIGSFDTPVAGVPIKYQMSQPGNNVLEKMAVLYQFRLDIATETTNTINNANSYYWKQSGVSWSFNGSGSVANVNLANNTAIWNSQDATVMAPIAGWLGSDTPSGEAVSTPIFNVVGRRFLFR